MTDDAPDWVKKKPDAAAAPSDAPDWVKKTAVPAVEQQHIDNGGIDAVLRGSAQGATFNLADEMAGAHAAGPRIAPGGMLGRTLIGAGRVAYDAMTGRDPEGTKAYEERRDEIRAADEAAKAAHPYLHATGEIAGAIPAIAAVPEAGAVRALAPAATRGAKFVAGALDAATQGGIYGGLSGVGEGKDLTERATEGASGLGSGVVGGALAHGAGTIAKAGYDRFGKPIVDSIRGWINPTGEASRRLITALKSDNELIMQGKAQGMSPAEWIAAKRAGEPVTLADLGSTRTQALLRSAANTSPEARAMLEQVIENRFLSQANRVGDTVRNLVPGGANARKTGDQLVAEYDAARVPAYRTAYEQGDRPIMTPAMERLMSSDTFVGAMKRAISTGKDTDVAMGLGGFNPMVNVTQDGRIVFNKGANGAPTYPNLQYWDQVKRELDSVATQAKRSGDTSSKAADLSRMLRTELDKQVPSYRKARGIAEDFFGESNALEAGRKLAGKRADPEEVGKIMRQMDPQERQLFQEGYASDLANRVIDNLSQTRDLTKAIFHNNAERKMIATIFGAGGVRQMEARMALEVIMDASRKAMGNSTTARQLIEAGLAGGALSGYASGWDPVRTIEGVGAGAAARFGAGKFITNEMASGAKHLIGKVDARTARRVAELLTSDDPKLLREGYKMAANNGTIGNALKNLATRMGIGVAGQSGRTATSSTMKSLTGTVPSAADQQQGRGPRNNEPDQSAGGKSHGGPVGRANGGPVRRALQSLKDYAEGGAPEDDAPFDERFVGIPAHPDAERVQSRLAAQHYFGDTPRRVVPEGFAESLPDVGEPLIPSGPRHGGFRPANRVAGTGDEERHQLWPETMVRSGVSLAGDVLSGDQGVLPPGLRREDYTDIPAPSEPTVDSTRLGRALGWAPRAAQPNDPMMERAQDMAGLAGGQTLATGAREAAPAARALVAAADSQATGAPLAALEKGASKPRITDNPNFSIKYDDGGYDAYVGKRKVGRLLLQDEPDGNKSAFGVRVNEGYRRRGVATALYQEAERDIGKQLVPSNAQHEAGFQFWKGYRPEALAGDMRMRRDELIGKPVDTPHGPGVIETVGSKGAIVKLDGKETTSWVPKKTLEQMLLSEDSSVGAPISALEKRGAAKRSTEIPNIREMPTEQAIETARKEPHLIKAGDQSEGYYVGGPREVQSKRALTNLRNRFDEYVAADPRGGDWYDRYRRSMNEVTGGDPVKNKWMSNQEGQWSAGVSPEGELGFALKENNAEIAGMPVKSARPAQHEAHQRAVEAKDPDLYQLGDKTGEYARLINPDQGRPHGATGVNDFRHARNFDYTEAAGGSQRDALTAAQHKFIDYETALAVDRANKTKLGGRSDWTGEQLQAAPWVRQKAMDLSERYGIPYEEAFDFYANKTIGDYFGKHTAHATHEAIPGADTGHLPGSVTASAAEREAFSRDPRSTWATAPGGRDAIYSGMGIEGTGNYMRVRPTTEMQGLYTPPGGATETNVGWTAKPLVAFDAGKTKSVAPADRALLDAGEATRGYIDAQNAAAWHKPWAGGAPGESNSLFMPMDRKATPQELLALQKATEPHGLPDISDTGRGVTATRFWPPPEDIGKAIKKDGLLGAIKNVLPDSVPSRVKVDSNLIDYTPKWQEGAGSGAATRELLEHITKTPRLKAAMSNNPHIAKAALDRLERDTSWAKKWGAVREDIQNARRIIGKGTGWVERLETALKKGVLLPAAVLAVFGTAAEEAFPERS